MKVLCLDIGNTFTKAQIFDDNKEYTTVSSCHSDNIASIYKLLENLDSEAISMSTVKNLPVHFLSYLKSKTKHFLILSKDTQLNFITKYPLETIGKDRVALISSIVNSGKSSKIIISAGTCITYDLLDSKNKHMGGAISPGLQMRLTALNSFTDKLPKVDLHSIGSFFNFNTIDSILSGVVNGTIAEMLAFINNATIEYGNVDVHLTGGDTNFLQPYLINHSIKLNIKYNSTLLGLYNLFLINEI